MCVQTQREHEFFLFVPFPHIPPPLRSPFPWVDKQKQQDSRIFGNMVDCSTFQAKMVHSFDTPQMRAFEEYSALQECVE